MMLRTWDTIPEYMKCEEVKEYYDILSSKKGQLYFKRLFDSFASALLILLLLIPMGVIAVIVRNDSPGSAIFRQERVTSYGKVFRIHKFRTMRLESTESKASITIDEDDRITRIGHVLRRYRLDEIPQLFDIFVGNMTFVGTRAEVPKYVNYYSNEMRATLLLPAGLTSEASIRFKDEAKLLLNEENADCIYIEKILPQKMRVNLEELKKTSLPHDAYIMLKTLVAVLK